VSINYRVAGDTPLSKINREAESQWAETDPDPLWL
jgi:hypothetical protein